MRNIYEHNQAVADYDAMMQGLPTGRPAEGERAEVFRGRKVPVGTTGTVIWIGEGRYGMRAGIKDDAGEVHWTALRNIRHPQD